MNIFSVISLILYLWRELLTPDFLSKDKKVFILASLWFQLLKTSKNPDFQWEITFLSNNLCLDIHFFYPPSSNVYPVICLSQPNHQIFQALKTILNHCTWRLPLQGSSSSEERPGWRWGNFFHNNQFQSLPRSFFHLLFSSNKWTNWLELYHQQPGISFFNKNYSLDTFYEQNKKNSRVQSSMSSPKQNSIIHLKMEFPESISF